MYYYPISELSGNNLGTFEEKQKRQLFENQIVAFFVVPGAGVEPARIAPLVFETSASTDSAIRANVKRAKLR